jgi:hypothetical protein
MTPHETKGRHVELHRNLDELIACYISETEKLLSNTTVMELMEWSHEMTKTPTCVGKQSG